MYIIVPFFHCVNQSQRQITGGALAF